MDDTPDSPTDNDYQAALARGLLPIREVARQTGVNPVTLRAWERRYGLVTPLRTTKGHRLYTLEEVARIRHILTWLDRGVAVGQVKGLLKEQVPRRRQSPPRRPPGRNNASTCWKPSATWPSASWTSASMPPWRSTRR